MGIVNIANNDIKTVANYIASVITKNLSQKQVIWFVSGGSNISIAQLARSKIDTKLYKNDLHIFLVDERFGPVGHIDSNWQQLINAGFDMSGCKVYPLLKGQNSPLDATKEYNDEIINIIGKDYFKIGQLGLGPDGHTSGLLPHNPVMNSNNYYEFYNGSDFQRITSTPKLINSLDEIVLFASGDSKKQALKDMLSDGPADETPARILKSANKLTIFTDIKL